MAPNLEEPDLAGKLLHAGDLKAQVDAFVITTTMAFIGGRCASYFDRRLN